MKILIYILLYSVFIYPVQADDIYKSVDKEGNVIFSDKPSEDAERIRIDKVQTIENPNPAEFKYEPKQKKQEGSIYQVTINNPADNSELRENIGLVKVNVSVLPELDIGNGDILVLYLDGNKMQEGTSGQFEVENVDRGTHTVTVAIQDRAGEELTRSSTHTFTLHRFSVLQPGAAPAPPPP